MRLFVALDFPETILDGIRDLTAKLRPLSRSTRWVRPEGMHVTLKFIGEVADEKLDSIIAALGTVNSSTPVEMRFRGVGFFPDERRPRVFWCGIEATPNLAELAKEIDGALVPLGIAAEKREFVPHLTLARIESSGGLEKLLGAARELGSLDLGGTRQKEFHLYQSVLRKSGAEYAKLRSFAFVKGAA